MSSERLSGLRVTVAGGGVGGPAAALLLARAGAQVVLLERVAEYGAAGGGYVLAPNGLAVLYGLGLADALRPHGRIVRETTTVLEDGTPLARARIRDWGHGLDHGLAVARGVLCGALKDAMLAEPRIEARYGCEVTGATRTGTVRFRAGGSSGELPADVVIGADGVRSAVRAHGNFGARMRRTPAAVIRLMAPGDPFGSGKDDAARGSYGECWTRLGTMIAGRGAGGRTYMSLAAGARPVRAALRRRDLAAVSRLWGEALPQAAQALAGLSSFDQLLVNEIDVVTCRRWADGRLVLLGDAAHAMPPHLGQGANSTLLDAAVLACELAGAAGRGDPVPAGLARYEARRRPAATRVQRMSSAVAFVSDRMVAPGVRQARNAAMRAAARVPGNGLAPAGLRVRSVMQEDPGRVYEAVLGLRRE
jgi:2-polyprenyl-6-methoxyphenol hydroxylase-like FAD-dependent oxidoreductase